MIVMVVGTLGSFAVMILSQQQSSKLQSAYNTAQANFTKEQTAYQAQTDAQSNALSATYYNTFKQYASQVAKYDIASITTLGTEDLVVGSGDAVTTTSSFAAYYIGWDANGHVFDQSIDTKNNKLKAPFAITDGLDKTSVISGWKEGLVGMHLGGVRLLSIPSDKAYGETGMTDQSTGQVTIAPNMPLKFVVMAIPTPAAIPQPDSYTKALQEYQSAYQAYQAQ